MVWIDSKRLLEVSHRIRQISPNRENLAQVVMRVSMIWVDAKRLFKMAERLVEISLDSQRLSKVVMGVRIVRLTPQHLAELYDCFFRFPV